MLVLGGAPKGLADGKPVGGFCMLLPKPPPNPETPGPGVETDRKLGVAVEAVERPPPKAGAVMVAVEPPNGVPLWTVDVITLNAEGVAALLVDKKPPVDRLGAVETVDTKPPADKLGAVETGKAGVEVGAKIDPVLDAAPMPPPKDIGADTEVEKGLAVED